MEIDSKTHPIPAFIRYSLKKVLNYHINGKEKNIFQFSIPRAGSTWLMEMIASQQKFKYYDEPFNIRRENVQIAGYFKNWESQMPGSGNDDYMISYLKKLSTNKIKVMNPPPFRRNHRFITNRIIFKIHVAEHIINRVRDELNGSILILLRHPIANTISRNQLPRVEVFAHSPYYRENYLTKDQRKLVDIIIKKNDHFEKGILSWCLQNLIMLNTKDKRDWTIITYEELLMNPQKSCNLLTERFKLPDLNKMLKVIDYPAQNITISDTSTLETMRINKLNERHKKLVSKWKEKVNDSYEKKAFEIIEEFNIDVYSPGSFIANSQYLNFKDTKY